MKKNFFAALLLILTTATVCGKTQTRDITETETAVVTEHETETATVTEHETETATVTEHETEAETVTELETELDFSEEREQDQDNDMALLIMKAIRWHNLETEEISSFKDEDIMSITDIYVEQIDGPLTEVKFELHGTRFAGIYDWIMDEETKIYPEPIWDMIEASIFDEFIEVDDGRSKYHCNNWEELKTILEYPWVHPAMSNVGYAKIVEMISNVDRMQKLWDWW